MTSTRASSWLGTHSWVPSREQAGAYGRELTGMAAIISLEVVSNTPTRCRFCPLEGWSAGSSNIAM